MMSRSSWYLIRGLILPVDKNPKTNMKTLAMAIVSTCAKTSIKPNQHVANMITNINIPFKHVYDARIMVIGFGKTG